MDITVTGPTELICGKAEFKEVVAKCEAAIAAGVVLSDSLAGMAGYISVDVYVPEWMESTLLDVYKKAGWPWISTRYIGELRFVLPTKEA